MIQFIILCVLSDMVLVFVIVTYGGILITIVTAAYQHNQMYMLMDIVSYIGEFHCMCFIGHGLVFVIVTCGGILIS